MKPALQFDDEPRRLRPVAPLAPNDMDDLTGFVMDGSDEWTVLNLPAIAEDDENIRIGDALAPPPCR